MSSRMVMIWLALAILCVSVGKLSGGKFNNCWTRSECTEERGANCASRDSNADRRSRLF